MQAHINLSLWSFRFDSLWWVSFEITLLSKILIVGFNNLNFQYYFQIPETFSWLIVRALISYAVLIIFFCIFHNFSIDNGTHSIGFSIIQEKSEFFTYTVFAVVFNTYILVLMSSVSSEKCRLLSHLLFINIGTPF